MTGMNELEQWFSIAEDDLSVAKICFSLVYPKKLSIACFHCQQSAEKALKGFLVSRTIEPPKTHDLALLCEMCIGQDASFNELYDVCSDLTPYGVASRYPKETEINEGMTQTALDQAQAILDFCLAKVPAVQPPAGNTPGDV